MSRWLKIAFVVALALAGIALLGLAISSADNQFFETYFPILIVVNRAIAVLLFSIVVALAIKLWQRYKSRQFGSHLTSHLALAMTTLSLIPTLIIFLVSTEFISRSIDSWFNVGVEKALDSGVAITRGILTRQQKSAETEALQISKELSNTPKSLIASDLQRILDERGGLEALVFSADGTAVAASGSKLNVMLPDLPSTFQLQAVKTSGIYSAIDGDAFDGSGASSHGDLSIRVIVPIDQSIDSFAQFSGLLAPSRSSQQLYLQIVQAVDEEVVKNSSILVSGYRDYQSLIISRSSILSIYTGTLFLTLLLTAFGAITASITFSKKAIEPLMQLEEGTRRVAEGDFRPIREFPGHSEINVLTQSFNSMIRDVDTARVALDGQKKKAEQAKLYLEKVLGSISSGVIVLTSRFEVVTANSAARLILGSSQCESGSDFRKSYPHFVEAIITNRDQFGSPDGTAMFEFEVKNKSRTTPLFVKVSSMVMDEDLASVLVFDDVTQLIEAQRATAWGEVARRLAHEIKNPLTPIRLAAERLQVKLEDKLSIDDSALLNRTITTIVTQVDALKQMVNDFRDYAKLPVAKLKPLDLNAFLVDSIALYREAEINIRCRLDERIPLILGDASQLRQVLHNLISNSIEAAEDSQKAKILVKSDLIESEKSSRQAVKLTIMDNGCGFSEDVLQRAFEPYVTSKKMGTGLGLPMVKKILDEHRAVVSISNRLDAFGQLVVGAKIEITFRAADDSSQEFSGDDPRR